MILYKWINVTYLKMKRIKLLLNYLVLLMNIHASIDRAFPFIFYSKIGCLLRKRMKKSISNKDEIEILLPYLTELCSVNKCDPCFASMALKMLVSAFSPRYFFT